MLTSRLRALFAEWVLRWQAGGDLPRDDDDDDLRWYEISYWC